MLHCYLDESATDGGSPIAVVAGIVLQEDRFTWLDIDWEKTTIKHGLGPHVHMKDFMPHGKLKNLSVQTRTRLFSDLVSIINGYKSYSIGATLSSEQYNKYFSEFPPGWKHSLYSMCFLLLAVFQGKNANANGYAGTIPFVMDEGNQYEAEVKRAHEFLINDFHKTAPVHVGSLSFENDGKIRALQAADVITWAVRRQATGGSFNNGFEPLLDVFDEPHLEQQFEKSWMIELSDAIRVRLTS